MKNSLTKLKDISESVLPATRNTAQSARKDLAKIKRTSRHKVKEDTRLIRSMDDAMEFSGDLNTDTAVKVAEVRRDRRNADNLGALIRWAKHKNQHELMGKSDIDKKAYFKATLPDTMQGRHALSHVVGALDLRDNPFFYRRYVHKTPDQITEERASERKKLRETLMHILETGQHKHLNSLLKGATLEKGHVTNEIDRVDQWGHKYYVYKKCDDCKYRIFEGLGQIEEFVDYLMRYSSTRYYYAGGSHNGARYIVENWFLKYDRFS